MGMIIKNVKCADFNTNIATAFLNAQTLDIILKNTNVYFVTSIFKKSLIKT